MKLTKHDLKRINQALHIAIDTEENSIDGYCVNFDRRYKNAYKMPKVPDPDFIPAVQKAKRSIVAWKRILMKINLK